MSKKIIYIKKADGSKEIFNRGKLGVSLKKAGASIIVVNEITNKIEKRIKSSWTTFDIYKLAFQLLHKIGGKSAVLYSLRRSILSLGPTGFPFEKYVAKILETKQYKTKTGVMLSGRCIDHEVDVMAYNDDDLILAEVKFHNDLGIKSDTKTALYIKARFDDLKGQKFLVGGQKREMTSGIIVTNTKFTTNAKKYAKCSGVGLISWDHPENGNLYNLIESSGIFPLICVVSLSKKDKETLISQGFFNCNDIQKDLGLLKELGISDSKIRKVKKEVELICSG